MARFASPELQTSGVYRVLVEHYEADFAGWEAYVRHRRGQPYPGQRILDGLHAGRTVDVPTVSLPGWAVAGVSTRRSRLGLAVCRPSRAIVSPDDAIVWSDENWAALWLEENDL